MPNISQSRLVASDDDPSSSGGEDIQHEAKKNRKDVHSEDQSEGESDDEVEDRDVQIRSKPKSKVELVEHTDDEDNSEVGEEEFVVEAIRAHKWGKRGTLMYYIKWVDYREKDNTWEPEENLLPDAKQILTEYHLSIGGPPQRASGARKRKSIQSLNAEESRDPSPRPKKSRTTEPSSDSGRWVPSKQIWDADIAEVETVQREDNGKLWVLIRWRNGRRTKVSMEKVYRHCPIPVIKFFEAHLKFT